MKIAKVTVKAETGLHARPVIVFVNKAKEFDCDVAVEKDGKSADAKKFLSVLSLGVVMNDEITLKTEGEDEEKAITQLKRLVEDNFHV
ncbi:HPr family phosphocarrier protein [Vallitalea pronyensis]|uniref:HPr family phosphocarrier protein n=1 Tax=Vallitalea pronyensis TaxID=1348613 RepID=A0A8J8SGI5_9FIRM|nr:HPr family phosphocarrier protein [Vallitalea pronyensis]QUI22392.1 HPr family phosphocarrier protein [Vallitalea pronyensis]